MSERFWIDGAQYLTNGLSEQGQTTLRQLKLIQLKLHELSNQQALMRKSKNAYIADLKVEIVEGRTGVDLSTLFSDE